MRPERRIGGLVAVHGRDEDGPAPPGLHECGEGESHVARGSTPLGLGLGQERHEVSFRAPDPGEERPAPQDHLGSRRPLRVGRGLRPGQRRAPGGGRVLGGKDA